jgi:hypothetical protein
LLADLESQCNPLGEHFERGDPKLIEAAALIREKPKYPVDRRILCGPNGDVQGKRVASRAQKTHTNVVGRFSGRVNEGLAGPNYLARGPVA